MIIETIKKNLPHSWGTWVATDNGQANAKLPYMDNGLYMNYIFDPICKEGNILLTGDIEGNIPKDLKALYSECNGFRLFLSSFSIYGQQNRKNEIEPFDIRTENYNIHARMKENQVDSENYFFVGSVCKDAVIAYVQDFEKPYVCMKKGYSDTIIDFTDIEGLINYFIPKMVDMYDDTFRKKSPNKGFEAVPSLSNSLMYIDEIC